MPGAVRRQNETSFIHSIRSGNAVSSGSLNLFDSDDNDIDYYYASRLPGEPTEGIEDYHFHPVEPRTFRVYLGYLFGASQ